MMSKLFLILFLTPMIATAGLFSITNRSGDCVGALCDLLETEVNSKLPSSDQTTFLNSMSDSFVMTQKGPGVDYSSNMTLVAFGGGLGVGADIGGKNAFDVISGDVDIKKTKGFGVSAALMFGINLGLLGGGFLDRTNLFVHFLSLDVPEKNDLDGEISSYGFHLQYKLVEDRSIALGIFDWGGVDITSGLEYSKMKILLKKDISKEVNSGVGTASVSGTATVGADIKTVSIPLEVSTNVRLLYILGLYGGLGMDFNSGSAKSIANINSTVALSGGASGGGEGNLSLGQEGDPSSFTLRNFIGLQLNLTALKTYVQLNNGMTNDAFGVVGGLRIVW